MNELKYSPNNPLSDLRNQVLPVGKHGFIRLLDWMGSDEDIVSAARVSMGKGTKTVSEDRELIRYLVRYGHTSPLEHCEIKFHVRVDMATWRQWIRHRTACLGGRTEIDLVSDGTGCQQRSISVAEAFKAVEKDQRKRTSLRVYCYDQDNSQTKTSYIAKIHRSGNKTVFQMYINNKAAPVWLTPDHRCLTNNGWMKLEQALEPSKGVGSILTRKEGVDLVCLDLEDPQKTSVGNREIRFVVCPKEDVYDVEIVGSIPHFTVGGGLVVHNSVNEYSQRYSIAIEEMVSTPPEMWRLQAKNNKQGSSSEFLDKEVGKVLSDGESKVQELCRAEYEKRLEAGVAREQARKDLPLSNLTEAYWKIDLHNLLHNFLAKRLHPGAQLEIRQYAEAIAHVVKKWVPYTWEAFEDYVLNSMKLSKPELDIISYRKLDASPLSVSEVRELKEKCVRLGVVLEH